VIPSLADFATHEDSAYSYLWDDCILAVAPGLGVTGSRLWNYVSNDQAIAINWATSRWSYYDGVPAVSFVEATNGGFAWPAFAFDANVLSVSMWLRPEIQTAQRCALSVGSTGLALRILVNTNGTVQANWSTTSIVQTSTSAPSAGTWVHVVAQRNRGSNVVELWINGGNEVRGTSTLSFANAQTVVCIGARRDTGTQTAGYAGAIDDVRIYQRMLSYSEIELLASQRCIGYVRR